MSTPPFTVRPVNWNASREALRSVRITVFVKEQQVPEELEWDDADEHAYHVLATAVDGKPIGTGRLKLDCHIGRMAVLKSWRGRGVGSAILERLIDFARREGCSEVRLHAQTHALAFYARFGFVAVGEEFDEAGMPHRVMTLDLKASPAKPLSPRARA
ncbi:MAG TPA: GNAT family N-acetyltransferase [Burkholderiales bacterium]|nr:GNAT family N-acetyltransferase [Burkholderiales bacterium]